MAGSPGRWGIFVPMPPRSPLLWKPNDAIRPDRTVRSQRMTGVCQAAGSCQARSFSTATISREPSASSCAETADALCSWLRRCRVSILEVKPSYGLIYPLTVEGRGGMTLAVTEGRANPPLAARCPRGQHQSRVFLAKNSQPDERVGECCKRPPRMIQCRAIQSGPHRLEDQDAALSRPKLGFESPWGHLILGTRIPDARNLAVCRPGFDLGPAKD